MQPSNRYMVIDDDPTNNFICEYTIRRISGDADIKLFREPEEALEFIREEYSHVKNDSSTLLFLDINMPSLTGWEFLDLFKELSVEIQAQFTIYILSSSVDHRDKTKAESNPLISGFLSKPLTVETVRQIMNRNLQNY